MSIGSTQYLGFVDHYSHYKNHNHDHYQVSFIDTPEDFLSQTSEALAGLAHPIDWESFRICLVSLKITNLAPNFFLREIEEINPETIRLHIEDYDILNKKITREGSKIFVLKVPKCVQLAAVSHQFCHITKEMEFKKLKAILQKNPEDYSEDERKNIKQAYTLAEKRLKGKDLLLGYNKVFFWKINFINNVILPPHES